jgi:hypothetical protein
MYLKGHHQPPPTSDYRPKAHFDTTAHLPFLPLMTEATHKDLFQYIDISSKKRQGTIHYLNMGIVRILQKPRNQSTVTIHSASSRQNPKTNINLSNNFLKTLTLPHSRNAYTFFTSHPRGHTLRINDTQLGKRANATDNIRPGKCQRNNR